MACQQRSISPLSRTSSPDPSGLCRLHKQEVSCQDSIGVSLTSLTLIYKKLDSANLEISVLEMPQWESGLQKKNLIDFLD